MSAEQYLRRLVQERAGQRLPGERDLAGQLAISRLQLRDLLRTLHAEGLVETRRGSGTYAASTLPSRLRQVALLIDEALKLGDDPFFSRLLESLQTALQAREIRCFIERTDGTKVVAASGDGVITLGSAGQNLLDTHSGSVPLVALLLEASARPKRKASVFHLDDRRAGSEAARFLWEHGRREMIFVGKRDIAASSERLQGAEDFCTAHNCPLVFVASGLNYSSGLQTGRKLPIHRSDPIGIIAANDWLAAGLWAGLRERGVPEARFPLVSFDGLPILADQGIASFAVPIENIVQDAVSELTRLALASAVGRSVRYELALQPENR